MTGRNDDPAVVEPVGEAGRTVVRSEEHLAISTVTVPARRVRLEKRVVTETRTLTVQVSREEVRIVDVDLNGGDNRSWSDDTQHRRDVDAGRWLTLSEERVVVSTEVVPVERVRLEVSSVVENREVTGFVRREQIDYESDRI